MNTVAFGSICKLQNGRAFKPSDWSESGDPIIRIQNLNDESKPFNYCNFEVDEKFHVNSGDLLFSWSGTPGTSFGAFFWQRGFGVLNQHIFKVTVDDLVISKDYLRYAINSKLHEIIEQAHGGVGLKHITKGKLEAIQIPLPPLEEQKRIAAILDKADAIRQKRKQAIDLADEFLRSVFLDMFGDPVTNPKGWKVNKLIDLVDKSRSISYGIVQRGAECDGGVPVVRISDFTTNAFIPNKIVRCAPNISEKYTRTILSGNELLISIRGTVGRVAEVPKSAEGWNVSREVAVIPLIDRYLRLFFKCLLLSSPIQRKLIDNVRGVAQSGISLEDLRNLDVIVPNSSKVEEFYSIVELCQKISRDEYIGEKSHLFNSLSQKAFSGQL